MTKFAGRDAPPPLDKLTTVTAARPTDAMSLAGMVSVMVLMVAEVIARSSPFQRRCEEELKLVPTRVRVKSPSPAFFVAGERDVITGPDPAAVPKA